MNQLSDKECGQFDVRTGLEDTDSSPDDTANFEPSGPYGDNLDKPFRPPLGLEQMAGSLGETIVSDCGGQQSGQFQDVRLAAVVEQWNALSENAKQELICLV